MIRRATRQEKGSTLLELVLYLGLSSIVLTGIGVVAGNVLDSGAKGDAIADVRYGASFALGEIAEALRAADGIVLPPQGATGTALTLIGTSSSTDPIVVAVASGTLMMTIGTGTPHALLPETVRLISATFEHLGSPTQKSSVRMTLELDAADPSAAAQFHYRETFIRTATLRVIP